MVYFKSLIFSFALVAAAPVTESQAAEQSVESVENFGNNAWDYKNWENYGDNYYRRDWYGHHDNYYRRDWYGNQGNNYYRRDWYGNHDNYYRRDWYGNHDNYY